MERVVPVLQIRDVYPESQIPDHDFYQSRIPDPTKATKVGENLLSYGYLFLKPQTLQNLKLLHF